MAKDRFHLIVKQALIKEGWHITQDPYKLSEWDPEWEIDLGAEKFFAAEKDNKKIAVEVKSFLDISFAYEFHKALGQYLNYLASLSQIDTERILYLAIPTDVWETEFQRQGIQFSIKTYNVKLIVFNPNDIIIEQWII
jgi:hypothetical protein